ncbi:hypothetical protein STANM309S_02688 [Streptomyces tanashiensis]
MPMDSGVWAYLAHPGETSPMPATGVLPEGVLRDDYALPAAPLVPADAAPPRLRAHTRQAPAVRLPGLRGFRDACR